jgi:hypothetical protein
VEQIGKTQEVLMHLAKKNKFGKFGVYYIWYQRKVIALGPQGKAKISLVHFILLKKTNKNDSCYKQFFFVMLW